MDTEWIPAFAGVTANPFGCGRQAALRLLFFILVTHEKGLTINLDICRVVLMKRPRLSPETLRMLEKFVERPTDWRYGYELSRETGLKSGTLYPILMRLEKHSLLEASWVATEDGVPPRHTYRLTPNGLELARTKLAELREKALLQQPSLSRG